MERDELIERVFSLQQTADRLTEELKAAQAEVKAARFQDSPKISEKKLMDSKIEWNGMRKRMDEWSSDVLGLVCCGVSCLSSHRSSLYLVDGPACSPSGRVRAWHPQCDRRTLLRVDVPTVVLSQALVLVQWRKRKRAGPWISRSRKNPSMPTVRRQTSPARCGPLCNGICCQESTGASRPWSRCMRCGRSMLGTWVFDCPAHGPPKPAAACPLPRA